jgi:hypothetical protein
MSWS